MIEILTQSLVPIFVCLLFGYAAGRRRVVSNTNTKELVTFLMSFALPCSLFVTIAETSAETLRTHWSVAVVLGVGYILTFIATYYAARLVRKQTANESAVLALTLGFPNLAGVGLPLLAALYGAQANISVAIGLAMGSVTVTPIALAIFESSLPSDGTRSRFQNIRASIWRALKKPVFWAPMLGIILALLKLQLPAALEKGLAILGNATEGAALFVTGLVASAQSIRLTWDLGWAVLIKSFLQPALCLGIAVVLDAPHDLTKYLVLLAALPSGFFGPLLGAGYGAKSEVANSSLIVSTALSILTLPVWIIFLNGAK
jgi:malonate transporter